MKHLPTLAALLFSIILSAAFSTQTAAQPKNTKLTYTYAAPQGYTYALRIEQSADLAANSKQPAKVKTNLSTTMTVKRAERDTDPGIIPLSYSFTNLVAKINAGGKPLPVGAFDQILRRIRVEQLVDSSGKEREFIIGATSPRREQSLRLLRDLFLRTLPTFSQETPPTPGATWTRDETTPDKILDSVLASSTKQVFKLEKIEDVQGRPIAFISSTITLTSTTEPNAKLIGAPSKGSGSGTTLTLFDLEKGVVQSHEVNFVSKTVSNAQEGASQVYSMTFKADMTLKEKKTP